MLKNKIVLTVPSTINVVGDVPADLIASIVGSVMMLFGLRFGGFTVTTGQGGWVSESFGLVVEQVTLVTSFASGERFASGLEPAIRKAKEVCEQMGQECVSLEINGVLHFIDKDTNVAEVINATAQRIMVG